MWIYLTETVSHAMRSEGYKVMHIQQRFPGLVDAPFIPKHDSLTYYQFTCYL